jgi:hypothetical protein
MNRPLCILEELRTLAHMIHPGADLKNFEKAFLDIVDLFEGNYPGYKACATGYHDLKHTTDTTLAMARLLHGASVRDAAFEENEVSLGLMAALMHDIGYIQQSTESFGSDAKLASRHVQRSVEFVRGYLGTRGYSPADIRFVENAIRCTDLTQPLQTVSFHGNNGELNGKMLAAADLLAQTADRNYLEKLPLLFAEFKEAGLKDYHTEADLFADSLVFNQKMNRRLASDLDGVNRYLRTHFRARWGIDRDMYQESIDRSMEYLKVILDKDPRNPAAFLRRKIGG